MTFRIAHIGDIHWGIGYAGPQPDSRFQDITRTMDWAADRIINEQCDLVLVAGDAFKDARVFLDRASLEIMAFADWLRTITAAGIEVIVISGTPSHDAIAAYRLINEMQIPGVTICLETDVLHYESISIACLPGMNRSNMITQEQYRNLPPHVIHQMMTDKIAETCQEMLDLCNSPAILLGHLSYDMADKGFEDVLMQHEPVLTQEAVHGFDLVCLGHIHRPQQNGNVFYCGSPERLSFNDEDLDAGFWLHQIIQPEDILPAPSNPWEVCPPDGFVNGEKWIVLSDFIPTPARRFQTIHWNEYGIEAAVNLGMESVANSTLAQQQARDAIVRLHYTCPDELNRRLDRKALERAFYSAGAYYVAEIRADIQRSERARDQEVVESMGPVAALERWARQHNTPEEEITTLQSMTAGLLEEAVS